MAYNKNRNRKREIGQTKIYTILLINFIYEANQHNVTLTTLMNEILAARYNVNVDFEIKPSREQYSVPDNDQLTNFLPSLTPEGILIDNFFEEIIEKNKGINNLYNEILAARYNVNLIELNTIKWKKHF